VNHKCFIQRPLGLTWHLGIAQRSPQTIHGGQGAPGAPEQVLWVDAYNNRAATIRHDITLDRVRACHASRCAAHPPLLSRGRRCRRRCRRQDVTGPDLAASGPGSSSVKINCCEPWRALSTILFTLLRAVRQPREEAHSPPICRGVQGLSFEAALRRLEHERRDGDASGFYASRNRIFGCGALAGLLHCTDLLA